MADSLSETESIETALNEDLERLVAENTEEVAQFLERLGTVNELLDTVDLLDAAMDDQMIRDVTGTTTNLGALADGVATDDAARLGESAGANAAELSSAIETLAAMQRSGTLEDLVELADIVSLASAAMDDEMVRKLASTGTELGVLLDTAADEEVGESLQTLLVALGEAGSSQPERVGVLGLTRALRDPEVRQGLGFLVSLARATGRNLPDSDDES